MLLQQALIGTSNGYAGLHGLAPELQALLPPGSAEQQLLLAAGMQALYHAAGQMPANQAAPSAAPDEAGKPIPAALLALLDECLNGEWADWWPLAAARLAQHGYVLPAGRLVAVLNGAKQQARAHWRPLLGARGHWLAQQNPDWSWVTDTTAGRDRATRWLDGSLNERVEVLREQRAEDAAVAREWLSAVWKGEKAEARQALLEVLGNGLEMADEALLEQCLGDRSQAVRATAAGLLARLPQSAFAQRLQQRAQQWLQWQDDAPQGALGKLAARLTGAAPGVLRIELPQNWDKSWSKEGLEETPPQGEGARAFWLRQLLAYVAPAEWQARSGQTPEAFIRAAQDSEWAEPVLEGLCAATLRFRDAGWADALFAVLRERNVASDWPERLFPLLTSERRHQLCESLLRQELPVAALLAHCPQPWPDGLNQALQQAAQRALRTVGRNAAEQEQWLALTELAVLRLPVAPLAAARRDWQDAGETLEARSDDWRARHVAAIFRRQLELIERRLQFDKEIPL